ncbi:hypothetical protein P9139_11950 [Curtobacterium flaccumfaciens]|nr:hypothetical protein P9139_11950 [Curtobacterium flaccumfaciens]
MGHVRAADGPVHRGVDVLREAREGPRLEDDDADAAGARRPDQLGPDHYAKFWPEAKAVVEELTGQTVPDAAPQG